MDCGFLLEIEVAAEEEATKSEKGVHWPAGRRTSPVLLAASPVGGGGRSSFTLLASASALQAAAAAAAAPNARSLPTKAATARSAHKRDQHMVQVLNLPKHCETQYV